MADNFRITAERTGKSSATLHEAGEFYNSCYLGGYVIECYQKILLQLLGSTEQERFGHAVNGKLLTNVQTYYLAHGSSMANQLNTIGISSNLGALFSSVISSWNPTHRYDDSHGWNEPTSINYQAEVKLALQLLAKLQVNGLI